jgi:long-chain acyl-CoA synthetase
VVYNNLVEMVKRSVDHFPEKAAYLWKKDGVYHYLTYADFWEDIKRVAAGLAHLGIGRNDKVAIISNNNINWPITDLALCSIGAISVPVYPTLQAEQITFILNQSECKMAVVENEAIGKRIVVDQTHLDHLVVMNPGHWELYHQSLMSFDHLVEIGERNPFPLWEDIWRSIDREQVATIIHTSGTTGLPKGAMLTHGNFIANIEGVQFWVLEARSDDILLSYLPLSHVFERMAGQYLPLSVGATIAYAESLDTIQDNLLEVKPTVMTSVPRLFEKVYAKVQDQIASGGVLKKKIFNWAIRVGTERYDYYINKTTDELVFGELPSNLRWKWNLANKLVYKQIKNKVGGRLRGMISGGAALNPEIGKFFWSVDIPVCEGYGLTETAPVIAANPFVKTKIGTVGKPLPNLEVRLAADGEVLVKGPSVMKGYYKDDEATADAFEDGWYKTGDIGELDEEGFLKIVDRKKSIIVLSTGKNVIPQPIENAVNQSKYVDQSLLIGQGRKYVIILVSLDYDYVTQYVAKEKVTFPPKEQLIQLEDVQNLLLQEINQSIGRFPRYEQPKKVVLCPETWGVETGEMTPSLKVKMREVEKRYQDVIDLAYNDATMTTNSGGRVILPLEGKRSPQMTS